MYIKQIAFENFKSYKGSHVIKLDKGHNILFGRNGSGKSNIGSALTLMFSASHRKLAPAKRESLINASSGAKSASIEIIVCPDSDNTQEISLKRVFTKKSDQFITNDMTISADQHYDQIASAFMPKCPFYLTFQGDIENWAISYGPARLFDTVCRIVGVQDFDQVFTDFLNEIEVQSEKIVARKAEISAKEAQIATYGEKYAEWNKVNKECRFLEHMLLDTKRNSLEQELRELEEPLENGKRKIATVESRFFRAEKVFNKAEEDFVTCEEAMFQHKTVHKRLEAEQREICEELRNVQEKLDFADESTVIQRKQEVQEKIVTLETKRTSLKYELQVAKKLHTRNCQIYNQHRSKIAAALRKARIAEELQRGIDVPEVLTRISDWTRLQQEAIDIQRAEVSLLEEKKLAEERKLAVKRAKIEEIRRILQELKRKRTDFTNSRNKFLENQKTVQRETANLSDLLEISLRESLKLKKQLSSFMGPEILQGICSLDEILEKWREEDRVHDVEGVLGIVLENFRSEPAVELAMEIAAGDQLFYFIVRDRDLILKFQQELAELAGTVSFIPLSDISSPKVIYPENSQGIPLISRLNFTEEKTRKVIEFIFAKTLVVRNLVKGVELVRNYPHLKFITLQGSQVFTQGHFRGGSVNSAISRTKLFQKFRKSTQELVDLKKKDKKLNDALERLQQNVSEVMTALQRVDLQIAQEEANLTQLLREIPQIYENVSVFAKNYEAGNFFLEELRVNLELLEVTRENLGTDRSGVEISNFEEPLKNLQIDNQNRRKIRQQNAKAVHELEYQLKVIDLELFQRKNILGTLESEPEELTSHEIRRKLVQMTEKTTDLRRKLAKINEKLERGMAQQEWLVQESIERNRLLREARANKAALENDLESAKIEEKLLTSQKNRISEQIEELAAEERNMATAPRVPNTNELQKLSRKGVERRIKELKQKEASFGDVLTRFHAESAEHLAKLQKMEKFLKETQSKMKEFLELASKKRREFNLKKFQSLNYFFHDLNGEFIVMFQKIVKNGTANLYPVNSKGKRLQGRGIPWRDIDNLRIEVSFDGKGELDSLLKFSGGQKTVVGFCLLFALQKLTSTIFFYLDEVDRTLDDEWRSRIASLIDELSQRRQFISISFKKEFFVVAHKIFKVFFVNGCSRIVESNLDEGIEFVERSSTEWNE